LRTVALSSVSLC